MSGVLVTGPTVKQNLLLFSLLLADIIANTQMCLPRERWPSWDGWGGWFKCQVGQVHTKVTHLSTHWASNRDITCTMSLSIIKPNWCPTQDRRRVKVDKWQWKLEGTEGVAQQT